MSYRTTDANMNASILLEVINVRAILDSNCTAIRRHVKVSPLELSKNTKNLQLTNHNSISDACGGVIEALNGSFTSPSFPERYPVSKECSWEIIVPEQYRITLNFTQFDLEGTQKISECDYDSVTVYSKMFDNNLKRHGTFCGSTNVPMITSESSTMRIEFRSDHTVQNIGFAAVFFSGESVFFYIFYLNEIYSFNLNFFN